MCGVISEAVISENQPTFSEILAHFEEINIFCKNNKMHALENIDLKMKINVFTSGTLGKKR